ncbi:MAG: ATP-binding cassette domain-containing protein [Eubacterium sp.]|nr:ATP-binding cassette domain-containing protein [Eubacterium sp.]
MNSHSLRPQAEEQFIKFENITYCYPDSDKPALDKVSFEIEKGDFLLVFGASGSGKSTLLNYLKKKNMDYGFVGQNPSAQMATDKVIHEIAFSLENQGVAKDKMWSMIAEISNFFGIESWMERDTISLSGGEKQLVNLAAALVGGTEVLLLDEPSAQLDPMAAVEFFSILKRINEELGITVIVVEQRLEEVLGMADKIMAIEDGKIKIFGEVNQVMRDICTNKDLYDLAEYFPEYVKMFRDYVADAGKMAENCPTTVKDALRLASKFDLEVGKREYKGGGTRLAIKNIYFRYGKKDEDIFEDASASFDEGVVHGIVGGNGSGKSTLLKIILGKLKPYNGKISKGLKIDYIPQDPKYMFVSDKVSQIVKDREALEFWGIEDLVSRHPYDVSGGQMQRIAFATIWDSKSDIILFDEPTKGLDPVWKNKFIEYVREQADAGKTIIMVSHDVEVVAKVCDKISMCFNRELSAPMECMEFFLDNKFFTTVRSKIIRRIKGRV